MTDDLKMIEDIADRLKIDSHMIRKKLKVIEEQPEAEHLPEVERLRFNFSLLADDMANELTKIRNKFRSNVVHNDVIEYSIECDNGNFDRKEMTKEHQNNILKEQPFEASSSESDSSSGMFRVTFLSIYFICEQFYIVKFSYQLYDIHRG